MPNSEKLKQVAQELHESRDFNPNSFNAQFAVVLSRMGEQDRVMSRILEQTTKTNGRVTKLEDYRKQAFAWMAGASFVLVVIFEVLKVIFHT